jgi:hypothetical protein
MPTSLTPPRSQWKMKPGEGAAASIMIVFHQEMNNEKH